MQSNAPARKTTIGVVALTIGVGLALAIPLSASAHVTLDDNTAEPGAYALVDIKVPNESATTSTTKVVLTLPTDTPFISVRYVPVPGWTTELVKTTLPEAVTVGDLAVTEAVTSVIWTAVGEGIPDGALEVFPLSLGPVPDNGSIVLSVDQTYSDGRTVSWSDPDPEADHPAPVLYVNDGPAGDHHSATADATAHAEHDASADADAAAAASDPDTLARVLGGAGLVLGAVALVIAVAGRRRKG